MASRRPSPRAQRPAVHLSIDVPNLTRGVAFYRVVFGFLETARPFPTMAILDAGTLTVCMHERAEGTSSSPGSTDTRRYRRHWTPVHLDFHVADFDAVLTSIRAEGGLVERELRTEGPRPVAFCSDPFGNGFCVLGEAAR